MAESFAAADHSKPFIANNSAATDRGYKDGKATATCLCGAVQLTFVSLLLRTQKNRALACSALTKLIHLSML
jgi:hypothetical protein